MGIRATWPLLGVGLLLAGCTPASHFPKGMTEAEVVALEADSAAMWWESIAPGEPQPQIVPVAYVSPDSRGEEVTQCLLESGLPGLSAAPGGGIVVTGSVADDRAALDRAQYICAQLYPYDPSEPEAVGYFSDAQLDYLADYARSRTAPCLRTLGYPVESDGSDGGRARTIFTLYHAVQPSPATAADWTRIDLACPPAPYLTRFRPASPDGSRG